MKQHSIYKIDQKNGWSIFGGVFINSAGQILLLNLLLIVFSGLIFTAGPAYAAAFDELNLLAVENNSNFIGNYFKFFKKEFKLRNILFEIIHLAILAGLVYGIWFYLLNTKVSILFYILVVLSFVLLGYVALVGFYFYQTNSRIDIKFSLKIKNAVLLSASYPGHALTGSLSFYIFFALPAFFWDRAWIFLIIFSLSLTFLGGMASTYNVVEKYVIKPEPKAEIKPVFDLRPEILAQFREPKATPITDYSISQEVSDQTVISNLAKDLYSKHLPISCFLQLK